jgi:hypothetical protein
MKFNKLPSLYKPQKSIGRRITFTQEELMVYRQEKIKRDIEFFRATVPYLSFFISTGVFFIFGFWIYNQYYEKRTGVNLRKKLFLQLLDIDVIKDEEDSIMKKK